MIVGHPGLELARGERAAGGHLGQDRCHDVRVLSGHTLHPAPGILLGAVHPEAEVPPDRPRHEAGFVSQYSPTWRGARSLSASSRPVS